LGRVKDVKISRGTWDMIQVIFTLNIEGLSLWQKGGDMKIVSKSEIETGSNPN
jgi:hypothetical protein